MKETTTKLTVEYIKQHPDIKNCLKRGIINYSSLARLIAKNLDIEKKTSKEAILIASRRFHDKLKKEQDYEKKIRYILSKSEIQIKNKIVSLILEKSINLEYIDDIQKTIRKESGTFYLLEGSDNYTIITQEKYAGPIETRLKLKIIKKEEGLVLIDLKSSKDIEEVPGVLAYITSLFSENGVNIIEFLSCWTDTLFVIDEEDLNKTINFLKF